ncbi:MAG: class I SAM-dependent methyltransferase [Chloroflexi bacterium]|nr:class I SAM-dependent methyltransferase [Chloroflexota bacterium]MBI5713147.1 class I SAM-dependent methyltransferase [Chloroflexota bacterium]
MSEEIGCGRFTPSDTGQIRYEHLHRYTLAHSFVMDKIVLDLASGEGYGSAMLADVARAVVGVDISPVAVTHAARKYAAHNNLKFVAGSCTAVPLANELCDVVVSFETLEHHTQHDQMMSEIKRVLQPHGILFLSTPNRPVFGQQFAIPKELHPQELDFAELKNLLQHHFRFVHFLGQRVFTASSIFPLPPRAHSALLSYVWQNGLALESPPRLESFMYSLALCADDESSLPSLPHSIFTDPQDELTQTLTRQLSETQITLEKLDQYIHWMHRLKFWRAAVFYWKILARARHWLSLK